MINEYLEVQQYLKGEGVNKECLQRICFLIACWYKELGYNKLQIREAIFEWANRYHYFLDFSVNTIIYRVEENNAKLRRNSDIYINDDDIARIKARFDTKNVRMVALAILCYSKAFADKDGNFNLSTVSLGNWVGFSRTNISSYYLKELIDFSYVEKVNYKKKKTYTWNKKTVARSLVLKLKVPTVNEGKYKIKDNDIRALYDEVFGTSECKD